DGLLRVRGRPADQLDLALQPAALGVSLVDPDLVAAREVVAIERGRPAVGINGADLDRLTLAPRRAGGERDGGSGQTPENHLAHFSSCMKGFVLSGTRERRPQARAKRARAKPSSCSILRTTGRSTAMPLPCRGFTMLVMSRGPSASSTTATV